MYVRSAKSVWLGIAFPSNFSAPLLLPQSLFIEIKLIASVLSHLQAGSDNNDTGTLAPGT